MISFILEKNLSTREHAQFIFLKLIKKNIKSLDFNKVIIISRSFANELYKLEKINKYYLEKINIKKEIQQMLDTADKELDNDILSKESYTNLDLKSIASLI